MHCAFNMRVSEGHSRAKSEQYGREQDQWRHPDIEHAFDIGFYSVEMIQEQRILPRHLGC